MIINNTGWPSTYAVPGTVLLLHTHDFIYTSDHPYEIRKYGLYYAEEETEDGTTCDVLKPRSS